MVEPTPGSEAEADLLRAQGRPVPGGFLSEATHVSPRTFLLGEALGAGRTVLGGLEFLPQALKAALWPSGVEGQRASIPTARAAPPVAGYGGAAMGEQPAPVPPGQSEAGQLLRGLNPWPIVRGLYTGNPQAYGGAEAMAAGVAAGFARARPGVGVAPRGAATTPGQPNPFLELGLDPRTATAEDVDAAFRAAAQRTHPDVPPEVRVQRGGPADPIDAALAFQRAAAAREAANRALGREPPVQGRQPPPRPAEAPVSPVEPVSPVRATTEPAGAEGAPVPPPDEVARRPGVSGNLYPELNRALALARQTGATDAELAEIFKPYPALGDRLDWQRKLYQIPYPPEQGGAGAPAAAPAEVSPPKTAEEAADLGAALADLTHRPREEWTPAVRAQYTAMRAALEAYQQAHPLPEAPPEAPAPPPAPEPTAAERVPMEPPRPLPILEGRERPVSPLAGLAETGFAGGKPPGAVEVPPGQPIMGAGATTAVMKQAQQIVGPDEFRRLAAENLATRQNPEDPTVQMAATEETARQIVAKAAAAAGAGGPRTVPTPVPSGAPGGPPPSAFPEGPPPGYRAKAARAAMKAQAKASRAGRALEAQAPGEAEKYVPTPPAEPTVSRETPKPARYDYLEGRTKLDQAIMSVEEHGLMTRAGQGEDAPLLDVAEARIAEEQPRYEKATGGVYVTELRQRLEDARAIAKIPPTNQTEGATHTVLQHLDAAADAYENSNRLAASLHLARADRALLKGGLTREERAPLEAYRRIMYRRADALPNETINFEVDPKDPEAGLKQAMARVLVGSAQLFGRFAVMREEGATDVEIEDAIGDRFGGGGGYGAPGVDVDYKGGQHPTFDYKPRGGLARTLKGKKLVAFVRDMLRIPKPGGKPNTEMPVPVEAPAPATPAVEAGAPHDQAAIQEGMFGERTLTGKEQSELLPETAGVPTAKLKEAKIGAEEVGRVRREGAEPAGERPMELQPAAEAEAPLPASEPIGYRVISGARGTHRVMDPGGKIVAKGLSFAHATDVAERLNRGETVPETTAPKTKPKAKAKKVSAKVYEGMSLSQRREELEYMGTQIAEMQAGVAELRAKGAADELADLSERLESTIQFRDALRESLGMPKAEAAAAPAAEPKGPLPDERLKELGVSTLTNNRYRVTSIKGAPYGFKVIDAWTGETVETFRVGQGEKANALAERMSSGEPKPKRAPKAKKVAAPLPEGRNPKYAKMTDEQLDARHLELVDRIDKYNKDVAEGVRPWVRKEEASRMYAGVKGGQGEVPVHVGTAVTGKAGRAIGQIKTASRLLDEVEAEMKARGMDVEAAHERAAERAGMQEEPEPAEAVRARLERDLAAAKKEGRGEAQRLIEARLEDLAAHDFEKLAREQQAAYGPKLRRAMLDGLEKAGHDRAELEKLSDQDLANRALEEEVLTPQQETDVMNVMLGERGGMVRPRAVAPRRAGVLPKRSVLDELRRLFLPATRGPEAALTAQTVQAAAGQLARRREVFAESVKQIRRDFPKLSTADGIRIATMIETGQPIPANLVVGKTNISEAVRIFRQALDGRRAEIQALGTGKLEHFIANYLPHIWEDPVKARDVMQREAGRRPLEGSKSFLKQRTIPTIAEGMEQGLKPATDNLADMVALKLREMDKYIMAHRDVLEPLRNEGLVRFERGRPPAGWERINDNVFTVYAPRTEEGSLAIRGFYYAPEPVARIINNYLSPGLRGNPIFDLWMGGANMLNSVQLGLSAFHALFITGDSVISRVSLGIGQLRAGRVKGIATIPTAVVAPISNLISGIKLGKAYRAPGSLGVEMERLANAYAEAGGRLRMDPVYITSTVEALRKAAKAGHIHKVLWHSLGLGLRAIAWPIMEGLVPAMKRGVFYDLARSELERLGHGKMVKGVLVQVDPKEVRAALQRAQASVDNRMGQVVYDNLFWNRYLKDALHASVRAVGWDMGSIREIGGGTTDFLKGKPSLRTDYIVAMVLTTALLGALYQYLKTGEPPQSADDLFNPRNGRTDQYGNAERDQLPSYMKDVQSFGRHPLHTASNKLNPLLHALWDFLTNRTYQGDMIRNPHDPVQQQIQQTADWLSKQFTPISVQRARQESGGLPFLGITPAPREIVRTPAQNMILEFLRERTPPRTPEQLEARDSTRAARPSPGGDVALVAMFRRLTADQRRQVLEVADDHERQLFGQYAVPGRQGGGHYRR